MSSIGIVYFSGTGTTQALAEAVFAGASEPDGGNNVHLLPIVGEDIRDGRWENDNIAGTLDACDAIVLGSPTYMGSVAAQFKAFLDAMAPRWYTKAWQNKFAAAFTASALPSGDKQGCLQALNTFAMQMGMLWIGTNAAHEDNPNGFYLGVGAVARDPGALSKTDQQLAVHLGQRVATVFGNKQ